MHSLCPLGAHGARVADVGDVRLFARADALYEAY